MDVFYTLVMAKAKNILPSFQKLFEDSWELFKRTILLYWKLLILTVFIFIGTILIAGLLSFPLFNSFIGSHGKLFQYATPYWIVTIIIYILLALVGVAGIVYVGLRFTAAQLLVLQDPDLSVRSLVSKSKPYVKRLFLSSLLTSFFVLGSSIFLLIPGILINFLLIFTSLIIVLEKQPVMTAMKKSYHLVKSNFWPLVGRFLLIQVLAQIVYYVLGKLLGQSGFATIILFLGEIGVNWFLLVYSYMLYTQVEEKTTTKPSSSLTWMWVLAGIGWVLLIPGVIWLSSFLPHLLQFPGNLFQNIQHKTV